MNDERVPWQADDPESGAVQVSGRPIHASWSMIREHFRRVFLEPHRPAGSDVVGWRWLGGSVPRTPEAADLADLRQLLQHGLLDITADLERRPEDPTTTSPRELLAAIKSIVGDLIEGTDIDLGTYAVETDSGWFIRSWGFSHPAPAKLADPSEAAVETPPEAPVEHEAPVVKPPVSKRTKRVRWVAGGVVVVGAAAAVFWVKGCARTASSEVTDGQTAPGVGETHEAPAVVAAHQAPPLTSTDPAAETAAHGVAYVPSGIASGTSTPPAGQAQTLPHVAADAVHSPLFSTTSAPGAQVGGMPVLPGQMGELGAAHSTATTHAETPTIAATPGGAAAPEATPAHAPEAAGASTPKPPGADAAAPLTTAHDGAPKSSAPAPGSGMVGLSPEAHTAPAKEKTAGIDAVSIPEIHGKPAPAEAAAAAPEAAAPVPAPASTTESKTSEPPAITDIVGVNKTANPPPADNPPEVKFDLTPDALTKVLFPPVADANGTNAAPNETAASPAGGAGATNAAGGSASGPGEASEPGKGAAPATPQKRAEATTVTYKIGECKVRCFRDPVLATAPAERPSNPRLSEARVQAWAGTQAAKPESFRKPVVNGGWTFHPAKGATWTKPPVWLDTATGKPVDGLRVSANGLHLNWTGMVPAEGFSAHIVDEDGMEQARISIAPAERLIEVTTTGVFRESAPTFTVDLTSREAVAGAMVWLSRTPAWSDRRWETQLMERQIRVKCLATPAIIKEATYGVVSLSHPVSGWALTWEVSTRPTAKAVLVP
jgi:hypothetical protein